MSEKTLASGSQMVTLVGKMATALSPVPVEKDVAQFWIDHTDALKTRIATLATLPTIVQVIGVRLGPCRGLASLIDAGLAEKFDVYTVDTILSSASGGFKIHERANTVVVDSAELYKKVIDSRDRSGRQSKVTIIFVNTVKRFIPIRGENVVILKTPQEALRWIGETQQSRLLVVLDNRISDLTLSD